MATTTNFGWETPDDTDLVKDGAAAIRTLGGAIDTSLVDLKGGTTGQVLSKASNTDMDFTWVAQDDSNAIQNAIVDAKGDLISATAADTPARLAVGTNGQQLYADSSASTGIKWADAAGWTLLSTTTLSGATTTISSINQNYKNLRMIIYNVGNNTADGKFSIKFNGLSTGQADAWFENGTAYTANDTFFETKSNVKRDAVNNILFDISIGNYASTTIVGKPISGSLYYTQSTTGTWIVGLIGGSWQSASAGISSLTFANSGGTFSSGTVLLYGGN